MEGVELNNIWQLLGYLAFIIVPLFFKFVLVDKPKNKKKAKEKKELENEIESLKDREQDVEIVAIKSDISEIKETNNWIVERMKSKDDQENLYRNIKKKIDKIIEVKELEFEHSINSELRHLIFNSQVAFKSLLEEIISIDFKISMKDLLSSSTHYLKNAKQKITREKLQIEDAEIFLEELEDTVIKPTLATFVIDFQSLENLENGVRRGRFAKITHKFITAIVEKSIDNYTNYAKCTTS